MQRAHEAAEVREQDAVDQEPGAVLDDDRCLAHRTGVGRNGGDGFLRSLRSPDHLDQRHLVHRVEEMHAEEVFLALERFAQRLDRDRRGVAGDDAVLAHQLLDFGQHRFLDLGILDHRLDDDVDVAEVAVVQRGADVREHVAGLFWRHLLALDHPGEQLVRLGHAQVQLLVLDVLHDDRRAAAGRLIGDATAHDSGAEHGGLLHRVRDLLVLLGFFLEELVVEEQADQRVGDRGLGEFREGRALDLQRIVAVLAGGLLHGLHGFDRRRVGLACLAGDEALRGFEGHHTFHHVQLERALLLGAPRLPVDLAVNGQLQHAVGGVAQFFRGDHRVHRVILQCAVSLHLLAAGDPLDGVVGTDQARQAHGAAKARDDSQLHFRLAHLGRGGHHPVVGGQRHFHAATQGKAVDGGDRGERQVLDGAEGLVGLVRPGSDCLFCAAEVLAKLGDVGADDEDVLGAGDQQAFELTVPRQRDPRLGQLGHGPGIEFVDRLALAVEAQLGEVARQPGDTDGLPLEHGFEASRGLEWPARRGGNDSRFDTPQNAGLHSGAGQNITARIPGARGDRFDGKET